MAAGLVAFAIMFGMCSARLNFAIPWSALISLCVTLSVDPALPYSLIRVADAEDHRDRGRWSRARHKACCGAEPMVRIHLPPAESQRTFGSSRTRRIRLGQNANNRARYKRSENQVHRTRVREVRIQFPPAESQQTFGSGASGEADAILPVKDRPR